MKSNKILLFKLIVPFAVFLLIAYIIIYFTYKNIYMNDFKNSALIEMDNTELVLSIEMEKIYDVIYTLRGYFQSNENIFGSIRKTLENILESNKNIYDILYGNEVPYNAGGLFVNGIQPYPDTYDQTSRVWYKGAISKEGIFITEPYIDANTGNICITLSLAVYTNNSLKGVIGIDFLEMNNVLEKVITANKVNLVTSSGLYMSHENKDHIFNDKYNVYEEPLFKDAKSLENPNKAVLQIVGNEWYTIKNLRDTPYKIIIRGTMDETNNKIRKMMIAYLVIIIILIIIQTSLAFLVVIPISQMLDKAMNSIDQMSKGNFIIENSTDNKNYKSSSLVAYVNNMKTAILTLACAAILAFAACNTAENVRDDAKRTPIGSVITGETRSADSYLKRVSDENKSLDRDTWRPISNENL